ncbi:50S ribosomal protein L29 [Candidatus Micrarchaeota archaeon CG_4_10_14_0_2_um_filter_55_9]|nr:MAG: 50S ribosomal protein L29 [Candidatus Micrarchaeota archaeon CG1_02_55_41]PIO02570.1 MAG: 50S ribosomal protein L29 [Candidatus Micrarchaeota archaeon CG09_land_8_20_14_0_10_55_25]PIZ91978.1 MAG: 50S ribosomal protein L29 [Candidatus Micrarchaeota archaeon CG_4_10_14_0_2_um_filter_55_9]PJD01023.1 MAG: 50S ribosomal protein L29 [Candidatus Micrarchaeota archaeon CG10_big_fil_rev_8_21_14_0_10_54_18]
MAVVRKTDLKGLGDDALKEKLVEVEKELRAEQAARKSSGKPDNPGRFRELKKARARIKTLLSSRKKKGSKE